MSHVVHWKTCGFHGRASHARYIRTQIKIWNTRMTFGHVITCCCAVLFLLYIGAAAQEGSVAGRPAECGDGIVQMGESCDDGNAAGLDGCSSSCTLEAGYMCYGSIRPGVSVSDAILVGTLVQWGSGDPRNISVLETAESCAAENICRQDDIAWQPGLWTAVYGDSMLHLPPQGFYCNKFCTDTFVPPPGHEFLDSCQPTPVNECIRGMAVCDRNAYCLEPADGIGYSCRCDPNFFVSDFLGLECQESGLELVLNITGGVNNAEMDQINIEEARAILIAKLLELGYIDSTKSSVALVVDGVVDYPLDRVQTSIVASGPDSTIFSGRSLWRMILRIPSLHANMDLFASSDLFRDYNELASLFVSEDKYRLFSVQRCANDIRRVCETTSDCLGLALCTTVPDTSLRIMRAGGSSAPLVITTSSSEIISVNYNTSYSAFNIRIRYDNTVPDTVDILYLSRLGGVDNLAVALGTLDPNEFPCLPMGTGQLQQQRESNVCCLERFYRDYSTVTLFGDFLVDPTQDLRAEIIRQGSCLGMNTPPRNDTVDLLDSSRDFMTGSFARTARSYATPDATPTRGYKDVNLFLAIEDVENHIGAQKQMVNGNRLNFFVGIAHVRPTRSSNIIVRNSQTEVIADITTSYVFTTQATTDFTFIKEMSVSLSELQRPSPELGPDNRNNGEIPNAQVVSPSAKFATITIVVPDTVTVSEVGSIFAPDSLTVAIGFSKEMAVGTMIDPCRELYRGQQKEDLDELIAEQDWCARQDPICVAQGPLAVGAGGIIQFTMPLPEDAWDLEALEADDGFFAKNVYIDFMLVVADQNGKKSMSNMQTQTAIKTNSVVRMCQEERTSSNILDIIEMDMFLGLAGNESEIDSSLVQSLDITRQQTPSVLKRDISSKASNVLTVLLKGDTKLFEKEYAGEYTLAMEDVITLHFLNLEVKKEAEVLIAAGLAFTQSNTLFDNNNSLTTMRLEPTPALLDICPLHAKRGVFTCNARREIKQRRMEYKTNSIVSLTGRLDEDEQYSHMRAGLWAQKNFGGSQFIKELAYNHSKVMRDKYKLNSRYRKGFLISPTVPWRQSTLDAVSDGPILDMAQHSITTMLVALDTNIGQEYQATVLLTLPLRLALTEQQIIENQVLLAMAYAYGGGLDPNNVYVDLNSIREQGDGDGDGEGRRRRGLLQSNTEVSSEFDMIVGFADADEETAVNQANAHREVVISEEPTVTSSTIEAVNIAVLQAEPRFVPAVKIINPSRTIQKALSPLICLDTLEWEMDITTPLELDLGTEGGGKRVGFVSCQGRYMKLLDADGNFTALPITHYANTSMNMRGPMNDSDWLMVTRNNVVVRNHASTHGWMWWDMCAPPPRIAGADSVQFLQGWNNMRSAATQHCCLCRHMPKKHFGRDLYRHQYSWPIRMHNETFVDLYSQISYTLDSTAIAIKNCDVYRVNPQIRNFRVEYGANVALVKTDNFDVLPPLPWDVDELGRTITPSCGPSSWRKNRHQCRLCDINTYRPSDMHKYPSQDDAYRRGGPCTKCPVHSVAGLQSTTISDCLCKQGYTKLSDGCKICPANTYKNTVSNTDGCLSCGAGYESRSGSRDISKCIKSISIGQYGSALPLYVALLGLIYLETPVETAWLTPPPIEQDHTMLCVLEPGGVSVDCGHGVYTDVFTGTPILFSMTPNVLNAIELVDQQQTSGQLGLARASILSFHTASSVDATDRVHIVTTPSLDVPFALKDIDLHHMKGRIKQVSLFPRPGYMGPAPPGFVEKIMDGTEWIRGIIIRSALRVYIANNNLVNVNAGNDVYIVSFISSRQLDTTVGSLDWQWIICGRTYGEGSRYDFCEDGPDPDNPDEHNAVNQYVLDGVIVRLNGADCCDSCFVDYSYMQDCKHKATNPNGPNMYENAIEWVPFLTKHPPSDCSAFWLYTFFTVGESAACLEYNCNEAAVYRNMPLHLAAERQITWGNSIDFLPGTSFTYRSPMSERTTQLNLYSNILGFVNMLPRLQNVPYNGLQDLRTLPLHEMFTDHQCFPSSVSTLTCHRDNRSVAVPVEFVHDVTAETTTTHILQYRYDTFVPTEQITYCCQTDDLDLTCPLEQRGASCNMDDNQFVQGRDTVQLVNTFSSPATRTCVASLGGPSAGCQDFDDWGHDVFDARQQPTVYFERIMSHNQARLRTDFTPADGIHGSHINSNTANTSNTSNTSSSANISDNTNTPKNANPVNNSNTSIMYEASYYLPIVDDDDHNSTIATAPNSGLVHCPKNVQEYLESLRLCSDTPDLWAHFKYNRTIEGAHKMAPCKTYQKGRDNFISLHAAELESGGPLEYKTVVALYKTPSGRNRVADLQTSSNFVHIAYTTDTVLFQSLAKRVHNVTLVDTQKDVSYSPLREHQESGQQHANVVNGICEDVLFAWVHENVRPCSVSPDWNPSDTVEPRSTNTIERQLPCSLTQQFDTTVRQVSYFREIGTSDIYATYVSTVSRTNFAFGFNVVTRVSGHFQEIMRSGDASAALLLSAAELSSNTVNKVLLYDSALRGEEDLWRHLRHVTTNRSCDNILRQLVSMDDQQQQYRELAGLLKRDGPCTPEFQGFDKMHSPSATLLPGRYPSVVGGGSDCVLVVGASQETGRDAVMAVTRQYLGASMIPAVDLVLDTTSVASFVAPTFSNKYSSSLVSADGWQVYFIPYNADNFGVLDVATDIFTAVDISAQIATDSKYSGAVYGQNGKIYCVPFDANNVGVFDPSTATFTTISIPLMVGKKYSQGILAPSGNIYFLPAWDLEIAIGEFDPSTGVLLRHHVPLEIGGKWAAGYLATNGNIYLLPSYGSLFLLHQATMTVFDTVSKETARLFSTLSGTFLSSGDTYRSLVYLNNELYMVPFNANVIAIFNIETHVMRTISIEHTVKHGEAGGKYIGGVLGPNGKIYFAPHYSNTIGELDIFTQTFRVHHLPGNSATTSTARTPKFVGAVLAANGTVYLTPGNAAGIGKFRIPYETAPTHLYSYAGHYVTPALVAGAVSGYIPPVAEEVSRKSPVIFDFGASANTTIQSWRNYAVLTAHFTQYIDFIRDGGVWSGDGRGYNSDSPLSFRAFLRYKTRAGYNKLMVRFANTGESGRVLVAIDTYVVGVALSGQGEVNVTKYTRAGQTLEIYTEGAANIGLALYIEQQYENPHALLKGFKLQDLTTGFCNLDNLLHAPLAEATENRRTALHTAVPAHNKSAGAMDATSDRNLLELKRQSDPGLLAPWVRLDLQYITHIAEVVVELENGSTTWDALKHYEIQVGTEDAIDANPTYVRYTASNDSTSACRNCQSELVSVDPDLLMWLQFDDPTFIGKDSSNFKQHAHIATSPRNSAAEPVVDKLVEYEVPGTLPLNSTHGPFWGSLLLNNFHFLRIRPFTVRPASDFTLSFWFVGMDYSQDHEHTIIHLSTEGAQNYVRVEQSWRHPLGVSTFVKSNGKHALLSSNRTDTDLSHMIWNRAGTLHVGQWNHYLLSVGSKEGTAKICLNGECFEMRDGQQAVDGEIYQVHGFSGDVAPLSFSTHMNVEGARYCQYPFHSVLDCYSGQLDELRIYQRQLTLLEEQEIFTRQTELIGSISATGVATLPLQSTIPWATPGPGRSVMQYAPWLGSQDHIVKLEHKLPHVRGRYVFIKFPLCDDAQQHCNTHHSIPIRRIEAKRQKWYFDRSVSDRNKSAWSWASEVLPDVTIDQPWATGKGLCFHPSTTMFSRRRWLDLPQMSMDMDLKKISAVTSLAFMHVVGSPEFGSARVYYDIEPHFLGTRWQDVDLSRMSSGHSAIEMRFEDGPVRARFIRIVLLEYPTSPPCLRVVPIICLHFCVGCCQFVQAINPLPILPQVTEGVQIATANVWHTSDQMCRCNDAAYDATVRGMVFERVFHTFSSYSKDSHNIGKSECHHNDSVLSHAYDGRHSRYVLGRSTVYGSRHSALIADNIVDFDSPEPIIVQQGVVTVIDWSDGEFASTPVYIAHQGLTKTPCSDADDDGGYHGCDFAQVDLAARTTSITVPVSFTSFANLTFFFYYSNSKVSFPVSIVPVKVTLPSVPSLFLRPGLFCALSMEYTMIDTLCPCEQVRGYTDAFGMALNVSLRAIIRSNVVMGPGDSDLAAEYTHMVQGTRNERIRHHDHLFIIQPKPPTTVLPFFSNYTHPDILQRTGDFVHSDINRAVVVNQFSPLSGVGLLYKDTSYLEDPRLVNFNIPGDGNVGPGATLHTKHTNDQNRWRALDIQTEESFFGAGGAGFVQQILPGDDWKSDLSIHIMPQVGINVRYPSDSKRPFLDDKRSEMYHNYAEGTPVHMSVFISSKKLNVSRGSTDWDWITCGAMTQNPVSYPPLFLTTTLPLMSAFTIQQGGISWFTAFASINVWSSQGGFLPDPPVCWDETYDKFGYSAQSPIAAFPHGDWNLEVRRPENTPCRLGQLEFPGPGNSAVKAGYSRCDITTSLKHQKMPCMYTLGDVIAKYQITQAQFLDVHSESLQYPNIRAGNNKLTRKIAPSEDTNDGFYVCHPEYNNSPQRSHTDTTMLRPDIACNVPRNMGERGNLSMIQDCVCGIITKTFAVTPENVWVETFVRVIPSTKKKSEAAHQKTLPTHGFITELGDAAVASGDVLSIGVMTTDRDITTLLPRIYFSSNPSAADMHATTPSMPAQYDVCKEQTDPDNTGSMNAQNPYVLDGIVVPLGKTQNVDQPLPDCCNFIRPHARVIRLKDPNANGKSRVAYVEGWDDDNYQNWARRAGKTPFHVFQSPSPAVSELWSTVPDHMQHFFPTCRDMEYSKAGGKNWSPEKDQNTYPCNAYSYDQKHVFSYPSKVDLLFRISIFDKVYVKKRGWIIVLFSGFARGCDKVSSTHCSSSRFQYDWQIEHMRYPSPTIRWDHNYNIPNDPYMWEMGDLLFGGKDAVGACAARCPSSGEYDNIKGTIQWKPKIAPIPGGQQEYWLYTMFMVGESLACKLYNCDEAAFALDAYKFADRSTNPDGTHPLTLFEGTSVNAFFPSDPPFSMASACIPVDNTTSAEQLVFQLPTDLFGKQRVTDFEFCTGCVNSLCQHDVMPCRWRSAIDIKWTYYMYVFHPSAETALIMTFYILDAAVIDSDYTNHTVFTGHTYSLQSGVDTPVRIPALAGAAVNIFTSADMVCFGVNATVSDVRRLLAVHQDAGAWPRQTRSSSVQRVHPLTQHGRKRHGGQHFMTQVSTLKTHTPTASEKVYTGALARHPAARRSKIGAKRVLLSTAGTPETDEEPDVPQESMQSEREITSINNNQQITELLCGEKIHGNTCDMLSVQKEVSIADFCLRDATFMQVTAAIIREELLGAGSSSLLNIVITSITRPGSYHKCRSPATRRLLRTEIIHITYVTRASDNYYVNLDILLDSGFSQLKRLTAVAGTKLSICATIRTAGQPTKHVSMDTSDDNHMCARSSADTGVTLELQVPTTGSGNPGDDTVQLNVAVDMSGETVFDSNTENTSNSLPTYLIAIITGVVILAIIAIAYCCVQHCKQVELPEKDTQHTHFDTFVLQPGAHEMHW